MRAVVGQHGVVDGILRQFGMQLAGFPVRPRAAVVVDAVGDVRGLLDLRHERPGADGMHTSRRQEEQVARNDGIVAQGIGQRMVGDHAFILRRSELLRETRFQVRPLICGHDVPHLGLAVALVARPCQLVVGVYLDREVLTGVDELHQQGEFRSMTFVDGFADQLAAEAGDKLRERPTRIFALSDNGLVARDARQLPALADIPPSGADALVGRDLFAAPDQGFELRRESKRSHRMLFFFVNSMISGI